MTSSRGTFSDKRQDLNRLLMLFLWPALEIIMSAFKVDGKLPNNWDKCCCSDPIIAAAGGEIHLRRTCKWQEVSFKGRKKMSDSRVLLLFMLLLYYNTHFNFGISLRVAILLLRLWMKNAFFCRDVRYSENIEDSKGNYWKKKRWIISHLLWQM